MACAYAKYTGKLGVCLATSGPGGIHLLNGLYDAKLDGQPVLAITGMHYHDLIGTHAQQDVELDKLFMDVAVYTTRASWVRRTSRTSPISPAARPLPGYRERRPHHVSRWICRREGRHAKKRRSATSCITPRMSSRAARALPDEQRLAAGSRRAERRQQGRHPCGRGALHATDELRADRRKLSARRSSRRCLARPPCPTTAHTRPAASACSARSLRRKRCEECDTLLMVGTSFPYIEFLPKPGQARGVPDRPSIPVRIGLRYPVEVGSRWRQPPDAAGAAAAAAAHAGSALPRDAPGGHEGMAKRSWR